MIIIVFDLYSREKQSKPLCFLIVFSTEEMMAFLKEMTVLSVFKTKKSPFVTVIFRRRPFLPQRACKHKRTKTKMENEQATEFSEGEVQTHDPGILCGGDQTDVM